MIGQGAIKSIGLNTFTKKLKHAKNLAGIKNV